jgi:hypothetical protein
MNASKLGPWLWGGVLCIALGLIFYLQQYGASDHQEAHASDEYEPEALLDVNVESLGAVEVIIKGQLSRLEKSDAGEWFNHTRRHQGQNDEPQTHLIDTVESVRLARGIAMLARIKVDRIIQQDDNTVDQSVYGLDFPQVIVLVYGDELAPFLILHIGDLAPDGLGRYVYLPKIRAVAIVPDYQASNLTALIAPLAQ